MRARWTCFVRSVFGLAERPVERRRRSVYQRPKASKSLKPKDILHLPLLTKGSSSVVNMSRKLTARGEHRRRELLAYATRAFPLEGFHNTSVSQIVAGLGVGQGVFYWYFDSKAQLLDRKRTRLN